MAEDGGVEPPRLFLARRFSRAVPSPIGLIFHLNLLVPLDGFEPTHEEILNLPPLPDWATGALLIQPGGNRTTTRHLVAYSLAVSDLRMLPLHYS